MGTGKPLPLAERQAFCDFAYKVLQHEVARCSYLMGVSGGGMSGYVGWLEYKQRQAPRRPVVLGEIPGGWIRAAKVAACVALMCGVHACGQSASVRQWQMQMTTRINAITACLSAEQRACVDRQEAPLAGTH